MAGRSCAIIDKLISKVTTGVVGHPVSELGKRGESPATCPSGAHQTELACYPQRSGIYRHEVEGDFTDERNKVVSSQ
jgi:hypothetical protein